jgi:hypothetical protein
VAALVVKRRLLTSGLLAGLASTVFKPVLAATDAIPLTFAKLYKSRTVLGMAFSDLTLQLAGRQVVVAGYMAPPLKPESAFFVLTRTPVAICPFCDSDADWPADIMVVYLKDPTGFLQDGTAVNVTGTLQVGSWRDPATGFVSQLRIVDASVKKL